MIRETWRIAPRLRAAAGLRTLLQAAVVVLAGLSAGGFARVDGVDCQLGFAVGNWLVRSQSGTGVGTLRCSNNDLMIVRIKVGGRGVTAGTRRIDSGHAAFSRVQRIHDLLGTYALREPGPDADVHAQHLGKDKVSLTLSGKEGWNPGLTFETMELKALPMKSWRQ